MHSWKYCIEEADAAAVACKSVNDTFRLRRRENLVGSIRESFRKCEKYIFLFWLPDRYRSKPEENAAEAKPFKTSFVLGPLEKAYRLRQVEDS